MDSESRELNVCAEWDVDRVSVSIRLNERVHPVWFMVSDEGFGREVDFLLPLTLFHAMVTGSPLRLPGMVSSRLFSAVPKIQDIFCFWSGRHTKRREPQRIPVDAEARRESIDRASGVACFFSGGVDSFYTLLKHLDEVTHLVLVYGFDIPLTDQSLRAQSSRMAREVARELGKPLIEVETNLRSFSDRLVGWPKYHGAALATVALLFQNRFRKVLIAASHSYADLMPWGSHPLLDPLWSTELTEIEHDGCEATRAEKASYISEYELAMKWLRVCYENPNSIYNCGRCKKCTMTMVNLQAAGVLERCQTLPHNIDPKAIADLRWSYRSGVAQQTLSVLERLGTEPELARALAEAMKKSHPYGRELEQVRAQLAKLAAHYSSRRYRIADTVVDSALRISRMGRLERPKNTTGV
jgi:hypothetical protein